MSWPYFLKTYNFCNLDIMVILINYEPIAISRHKKTTGDLRSFSCFNSERFATQGIFNFCPIRSMSPDSPLAAFSFATVVFLRKAIAYRESPFTTV